MPSATARARLWWGLKFPLWIGQPAVERKYRLRIAVVGHGDLKGGEFRVPFIDLDAADVLFGPRLVIDPHVAIGMKKEQWLFPSGSRLAKRHKERGEFVLRLARFNHEW